MGKQIANAKEIGETSHPVGNAKEGEVVHEMTRIAESIDIKTRGNPIDAIVDPVLTVMKVARVSLTGAEVEVEIVTNPPIDNVAAAEMDMNPLASVPLHPTDGERRAEDMKEIAEGVRVRTRDQGPPITITLGFC